MARSCLGRIWHVPGLVSIRLLRASLNPDQGQQLRAVPLIHHEPAAASILADWVSPANLYDTWGRRNSRSATGQCSAKSV